MVDRLFSPRQNWASRATAAGTVRVMPKRKRQTSERARTRSLGSFLGSGSCSCCYRTYYSSELDSYTVMGLKCSSQRRLRARLTSRRIRVTFDRGVLRSTEGNTKKKKEKENGEHAVFRGRSIRAGILRAALSLTRIASCCLPCTLFRFLFPSVRVHCRRVLVSFN